MKVLITGAEGFIGKNLVVRLRELPSFSVIKVLRSDSEDILRTKLSNADVLIHLAGVNRPKNSEDFDAGNIKFTDTLCKLMLELNVKIPILFSSSTQASLDNAYGQSKRTAEIILGNYSKNSNTSVVIYRLPGVFGKWCKPNYNSVVSTFCNNIANGLPIKINDPTHVLDLVYIDDVIDSFIECLKSTPLKGLELSSVNPIYNISLGDLAEKIQGFMSSRESLSIDKVGKGFTRALYATFISYLPQNKFKYPVPQHQDDRGIFVEMLKTKDSGQFSFFTAHPGVTRGGHYHHTKIEKFLVIKGEARFRFHNILTNNTAVLDTSGKIPEIVETIPGYSHDITNMGGDELVVVLWANEIFDKEKPDTIWSEIDNDET